MFDMLIKLKDKTIFEKEIKEVYTECEVNKMKLLCIMDNGFEELEAVGTIALLRRAGITIDVAAVKGHEVAGRFELTFTNVKALDEVDPESYDGVFLPGGPHYQKIEQNDQVKGILKSFFEKGKLTAAICAGPTVLGHMGLLKGKKYTCFTSMNEDFGGTYVDQYVVTDGNLITGRSAAASIDMAFAIIEYVLGQEECEKVKQSVYY